MKKLTDRQLQILKKLACGDSVKVMAFDLKLSSKTIAFHILAIRRKLGIHNTIHLVHYALHRKIIVNCYA